MESRIGEVRKFHVVYFLSRGGQVEHPHLIKVQQVDLKGLRLRDVKRWLSKVRGDDMPDSFSWSYKRKYKSSYVWQDLRDDDLITPISDSEYVLKGSEILPTRDTRRCSCDQETPRNRLQLGDLQINDEQLEDSNLMSQLDSPLRRKIDEDLQRCSVQEPYKELPGLKGRQSVDECEDSGLSGEYSAKITSCNKPPKSPNQPDEEVRVYKAVISASTGPKLDAAAQTGESQRLFTNGRAISSLLDGARKVKDGPVEKISAPNAHEKLPTPLLTLARNDAILSTCENRKFPPKESRQGKRSTLASHVLKQLFTCGGLETNDSRIHSVKALPSVKLGRRSTSNADNSPSNTSPKKTETQSDLTNSNTVPNLQILQEKSVFEKSDSMNSYGSFHKSIDSKSPKSSESQSSSSGEIAAENVIGVRAPDVNYCIPINGRPQISLDSPTKVPESPAALGDNVIDEFPSPLLYPKTISPKIQPSELLSIDVETNCITADGREDRQNTRSNRREFEASWPNNVNSNFSPRFIC